MNRNKIVFLCPDQKDQMFHGRWRSVMAQLCDSLRRFNFSTEVTPWVGTDSDLVASADLVLPLLAWGYQRAYAQWLSACTEWAQNGVPVQNVPDVLKWNSDKRYLMELHAKGTSVVPSLYYEKISQPRLLEASEFFGTHTVVVKPTISATAYKTSLWKLGGTLADPPDGPCIVQPFVTSIVKHGEVSLIFLDGQFSHGLQKIPREGDFRVQPEFGGRLSRCLPEKSLIVEAEKVLENLPKALLYARIDMVLGDRGNWMLMEAELIEPDLFIGMNENRGELFGQAVRNHIRQRC